MLRRAVSIIVVTLILLSSGSMVTAVKYRNLDIESAGDNLVKLDGSIIAEVSDEFFGSVFPSINLSDKYTFEINVSEIEEATYQVDSSVKIPVEVVNDVTKQYLFGRYLTTLIFIVRKNRDELLQGRLLGRILRSIERFNVFSEEEKFVEIPLNYNVDNLKENASLYIFAIGSIIGILSGEKPVFVHKRIDLEFLYNATEKIDVTPPTTICIVEGEKI